MRRILPMAMLFLASLAAAQIHGVPASVTSVGKGWAQPHGVPASVTSLGPGGYNDLTLAPFPTHLDCRGATCFPATYPPIRTRSRQYPIFYPIYYPVYPQPPVIIINTNQPAEAEAQYDGEPPAPTIFERRPRTRAYAREERPYRDEEEEPAAEPVRRAPARPEPAREPQISAITPEESTLFVLLDGTRLELHNFAIVGDFVWNFDAEGPRKILLAQLDLEQTLKLNADRGTDLRLPNR